MGAAADTEWLRWVSRRFGNGAGKEKEISLEEFQSALQVKESFFAERFFALFDSDGSGSLSREELLGSLRRLLRGNSTEKLRFLFQVYDVDGSGSIDAEELRAVLRGCLQENSLALPEERLGALSQALLQALDRDRSGSVTFPELREQLEAFPELLESLSSSTSHAHSCSHSHSQIFYWSHLSYIPVWVLLLLHAPQFWKWFLIPGSLFVLEKVLGWAWRRAGDVHILEAKLLPSKVGVTHLVIQRPRSFRFQPGDYVYLNVPAIAAYEWHPFSISSAPEQPENSRIFGVDPTETLWLHIRARGQWTTKLYEYFQQLESHGPEPNPPGKSWRSRHREQVGLWDWDQRDGCSWMRNPALGSGAGIWRRDPVSAHAESRPEIQVDFIWITRDQQHLQWFLGLLAKLETEQEELEPGGERHSRENPQGRIPAGRWNRWEFQGISWSCSCT
ncbi:NADPH oxidase 5 [Lonchura striata]|uniref:NADPH oxidase 5 n=1 Tax=Lonchura striata TaxID=40157 RepID=A0A218UDF7_9PASE|nr:NADPH oxidase 5 [Lonchura striata domestica]